MSQQERSPKRCIEKLAQKPKRYLPCLHNPGCFLYLLSTFLYIWFGFEETPILAYARTLQQATEVT